MSTYPRPAWPEALATVTECHLDAGLNRPVPLRVPVTKNFRITYNYLAPNAKGIEELHTAHFDSPHPMRQGSLFAVNYNPANPDEHKTLSPKVLSQTPNFGLSMIACILLALACLIYVKGCRPPDDPRIRPQIPMPDSQ